MGTVAASPTVRKVAHDLGNRFGPGRGKASMAAHRAGSLRAYIQQLQRFAFESGTASAAGMAAPKPGRGTD